MTNRVGSKALQFPNKTKFVKYTGPLSKADRGYQNLWLHSFQDLQRSSLENFQPSLQLDPQSWLPWTPALLSNAIIRNETKLTSTKKCHPMFSEIPIKYLKYVFSNSKDNLSANFTFLKMQFIKLRSNIGAMFSPRVVLTNFSLLHWFPKQHIILNPQKMRTTIHISWEWWYNTWVQSYGTQTVKSHCSNTGMLVEFCQPP